MTRKFDKLVSALLEAGCKKKPRKKKSNYKWDSRSGKYYKPKTVSEDMVAGGLANVDLTSSHFSSDSYAKGDARIPTVLGAKKKKKKKGDSDTEMVPTVKRQFPETIFSPPAK